MTTRSTAITMANRVTGALWGHLVGDATGVPYEFRDPSEIGEVVFGAKGTHHQPAGTWSDDGALMLALLASLVADGPRHEPRFDLADQGRRAVDWRQRGHYTPDGDGAFDIGGTTSEALRALRNGTDPLDAGPKGEHACGNGSLMRILPLAVVYRDAAPAALIEMACQASRVTHGHPRAQVTCAVYCLTVAGVLRGESVREARATAFAECERHFGAEDRDVDRRTALEELRAYPKRRGSGYVLDAFWSAMDAVEGASTYQDAIVAAIEYGNDTDTTAAIAGGLAGARFGWSAIPSAWLAGMRGRDVAQPLIDTVAEAAGVRTSTFSPLRVDEMDLDAVPSLAGGTGRLGITYLPGRKQDGYRADYWRDLDLDIATLQAAGVGTLLLHNEDRELASCLVTELPARFAAAGRPRLVRFPIRDPRVPTDVEAYLVVLRDMLARVRAGEFVVVACRGGIDRSGMTASALLVLAGVTPDEAMANVQAHRKGSITLGEQRELVRSLAGLASA